MASATATAPRPCCNGERGASMYTTLFFLPCASILFANHSLHHSSFSHSSTVPVPSWCQPRTLPCLFRHSLSTSSLSLSHSLLPFSSLALSLLILSLSRTLSCLFRPSLPPLSLSRTLSFLSLSSLARLHPLLPSLARAGPSRCWRRWTARRPKYVYAYQSSRYLIPIESLSNPYRIPIESLSNPYRIPI